MNESGQQKIHRRLVNGDAACRRFGPFTVLIVIVPMLLGARLTEQARCAGEVVFGCSAILVVLVGAWITGNRIAIDGDIRRWHPGYFLPTAAAGLLAGGASAGLDFTTLSRVLFGLGITSFVVLAPIISLRLYDVPSLPPPLFRHSRSSSRQQW